MDSVTSISSSSLWLRLDPFHSRVKENSGKSYTGTYSKIKQIDKFKTEIFTLTSNACILVGVDPVNT